MTMLTEQILAQARMQIQAGRFGDAVALYQQVLAAEPNQAAAHFDLAELYNHLGRRNEAIAHYQWTVRIEPNHLGAQANLSIALAGLGRLAEAITAAQAALRLSPHDWRLHNNLGNLLRSSGRLDEAVAAYQHALALQPDYPSALNNLGSALREQGRLDEAAAALRSALKLDPTYTAALFNLGNTLKELSRGEEAIASYQQALQIKPDYAEARLNLANTFKDQGRFAEAVAEYERTLQLQPNFPGAHYNLGIALAGQDRLEEALAAYRRALQVRPDHAEAFYNSGVVLSRLRRPDEAIAAFQHALQIKPDYFEAYNNLGNEWKDVGRLDEAIAAYRRATHLQPQHAGIHSNGIYALHFHPQSDSSAIGQEQGRWRRQFEEPAQQSARTHDHDADPERRLRVGYISPEFRDHVTGRYLIPLFRAHDRQQFELICYVGVEKPDHLTEEFRAQAGLWRDTVGVPDAALAGMIREDGVDILVDLTQHLSGNRLPVFAHRAAPVQVSLAGYPESTGLESIPNRISDRGVERLKRDDAERVFLIDSFWCYDSCEVAIEPGFLPAPANGCITFGCLNNFGKINEVVLRLWARILRQVPGSRLVMLTTEGSHRQRTCACLGREGISAQRIEFEHPRPRESYLELYRRLDVALDPFPYGGHTTSLDAMWMGVPVVSLVGDSGVARAGLSQFANIGLEEFAAFSEDEYVRIASELAGDVPRRTLLRRTLRNRMESSPLMDAGRFARQIEAAYRTMWRRWCATKLAPPSPNR